MTDREAIVLGIKKAVRGAVEERMRKQLPEFFPPEEPDEPLPPLRSLFPDDFPVAAVAEKYGVTIKVGGRGGVFRYAPDVPAYYDPDTKTITLNVNVNREKVAEEVRRRCYVRVESSEVYCFVVLHETAHHIRRNHLPPRNGLLAPLDISESIEVWGEEAAADKIAERLFYQWRWTKSR